ncbi:GGDEF domain-containing protein [Shewanella sp. Choline-02u-19]|uniref:EAL domain-containing protein n=1 Tax=unclassified Shewanella TaxID=196818 RepID=UPI000C3235E1|nr:MULTISPECIES: EAL domain-containing protein [unclassified Shewanella]PKG57916.1 GGDEF domain-containing protein [Shewanella sp. GutDb-MelDb]PKH54848.1 GGDEF domain-containing protein [Shewanella sp. Bg11-22]PKI26620.1 GGDEF domain-containing protein [Shewanella sp. Choline-02u-19]
MDQSLIFSLIQNAALLLAMVFVYDAFPRSHKRELDVLWRIGIGALVGVIAVSVMLSPWQYSEGAFFDSRTVILGISGMFFGGIPTLVAVLISGLFRLSEGGVGVWSGIGSIMTSALVGYLWGKYRKGDISDIRFRELLIFGFSLNTLVLLWGLVMPLDAAISMLRQITLPVLIIFPITTAFLGMLLSRRIEIERDQKIKLQDHLLFKSHFQAGSMGIAITDNQHQWIKVNPNLCHMLQYSEPELLELLWSDLIHHNDFNLYQHYFSEMLAGDNNEFELDIRFIANDDSIVYTHMTVACQRNQGKVELVIIGLLNRSSQKQAEMAMLASQEQLGLVLDSSELGFWDWDIVNDKVERNEHSANLLGCDVTTLNNNPKLWMRAIHPKDRVGVLSSIDEHISGVSEQHKIEYRMYSHTGEIRWILDSGKIVSRDENNKPLRMCGVHTDITDRKRVEESLKLAASVYNNSSEAMSVQDEAGTIININAAFTDITGYSDVEIKQQNIQILQCNRNNRSTYEQMELSVEETGRWQGETWLRRKNGEEFVVWLTLNTLFDAEAQTERRVALFSDITDKKQAEQIIWKQANYDPLTGLPNRRMLLDYLGAEILKSDRREKHFALMFLDLDYFKEVNDTLGHDMGDLLLTEAAKRLKSCIRDSDVVARLGGDEFTVVLSGITDIKGVDKVAQNILNRIAEPFNLGEESAYISASIGITLYPDDAASIEGLLKHADQAMYAAKDQGRNRFHYFTPSMQRNAKYRMRLIQDLRLAISNQEFELYYQPIVGLADNHAIKAEALIRWNHPKRGLVSPIEFISVAEETGLIIEIGDWVFQQAARQCALWRDRFGIEVQISINKSPVQFRDEGESFESWIALLKTLNLSRNSICIEITEGLLLDSNETIYHKLAQYRAAGMQISLDDFGTGYSSLAYLKKFDIDFLKIDQSFTQNLDSNSDDSTLCEAIIVMAHKLGMKVIAEGVETDYQRQVLLDAGCDYGQGYLFSRPVPAEQFETNCIIPATQKVTVEEPQERKQSAVEAYTKNK